MAISTLKAFPSSAGSLRARIAQKLLHVDCSAGTRHSGPALVDPHAVDGRGKNPLQIERRDVVGWCLRARGTGISGSVVSVDSEVLDGCPMIRQTFPVWRSHVPTGHG